MPAIARGARQRADRLARARARTRTSAARASPRACGRRWRSPARWCTTRRLIILDEPLTGLDAGSARQVKNVLRERVAAGGTVIMTTHILEVAERMADRIGVIAGGRLIAEGTLDELRAPGRQGRHQPRRHVPRAGRRAGAGRRDRRRAPLAWFAHHEFRLAWRDWLSMLTAGKRRRARVVVALALSLAFARVMHFVAYSVVGNFAEIEVDADRGTLVVITGCALLAWSLMMSQAMESVTRAFYARSDLDLILSSPVASRTRVRGADRDHGALDHADGGAARGAASSTCWSGAAARAGSPPTAWCSRSARSRRRCRSR